MGNRLSEYLYAQRSVEVHREAFVQVVEQRVPVAGEEVQRTRHPFGGFAERKEVELGLFDLRQGDLALALAGLHDLLLHLTERTERLAPEVLDGPLQRGVHGDRGLLEFAHAGTDRSAKRTDRRAHVLGDLLAREVSRRS